LGFSGIIVWQRNEKPIVPPAKTKRSRKVYEQIGDFKRNGKIPGHNLIVNFIIEIKPAAPSRSGYSH
jgi:hypothetical protein